MSAKPIALEDGLATLRAENYAVEVREQHLLVHNVPYVNKDKEVRRGTLVCTYIESGGQLLSPDNHQVWFTGDFPCYANGLPMEQLRNDDQQRELFVGLTIRHRFSNKPFGALNFSDHYSKMVHYVRLLSDQARVIEPEANACTGVLEPRGVADSVFRYADTASARAEILALAARLALARVAIVGLGGTGSYILDQVSKTHVQEIHLFDGDTMEQHNAFRSPGAATLEELQAHQPKTEYFLKRYEPMRRGIFSHAYFLDESNVGELEGFDFVFVCVDQGPARRLICEFLQRQKIAFIDVGMSVELVPETDKLIATCRFTLCTPQQNEHFERYVPMDEDTQEALYRRNIQIADMNAMNAMLAVMKWKQYFGFYQDEFGAHQGTFTVGTQSLTRDVMTLVAEAQ